MTLTPKQVESWKKMRALGRLRYVLMFGVGTWGVPMFVVMTFVANRETEPGVIAMSAVAWLLGGAAFGAGMWAVFERQYRKTVGED